MSDYTFNSTSYRIKVNPVDGILQPATPITLKNQNLQLTLENIGDVVVVDAVDGATLVYNTVNNKYEVKKLDISDIADTINLDGGVF